MKKWEGHTHSKFCQHGSGDNTALMIERAIEMGFERYSITEHAPLPDGIVKNSERREFGLLPEELNEYFSHVKRLKKEYGRKIEIRAGLEVDFFSDYVGYSKNLIETWADQLEDIIISIHFIKGRDNYSPIDYNSDIFYKELVGYWGSVQEVHQQYWNSVKELVNSNISSIETKRIGHIGLINKYKQKYPQLLPESLNLKYESFLQELFRSIKRAGWSLDYNISGLSKPDCREVYFTDFMFQLAQQFDIQLIYGSDAHCIERVGRSYEEYERRFV